MERTSRWGPAIAEGLHETAEGWECGNPQLEAFEAQVEEARQAIETGVADARGDHPEVGEHDLYHDIAGSIVTGYPAEVRAEVFRRLGFDAEGL